MRVLPSPYCHPGLEMPLAMLGLSWSLLPLADVCLAVFLTHPQGMGEIQQGWRQPVPTASIPGAGEALCFPCHPI